MYSGDSGMTFFSLTAERFVFLNGESVAGWPKFSRRNQLQGQSLA